MKNLCKICAQPEIDPSPLIPLSNALTTKLRGQYARIKITDTDTYVYQRLTSVYTTIYLQEKQTHYMHRTIL